MNVVCRFHVGFKIAYAVWFPPLTSSSFLLVWILGHVLSGWDGTNPLENPTNLCKIFLYLSLPIVPFLANLSISLSSF